MKIVYNIVKLIKATISWSVGLCVAGGAVLRYEIQLKNKIDSELNNNDENTVGTIERPNQDKQGTILFLESRSLIGYPIRNCASSIVPKCHLSMP